MPAFRSHDTVASESMGYVGYYSRRVVYDYPGLQREVPTSASIRTSETSST